MEEDSAQSNKGCIPGGCGPLGCTLLVVIPMVLFGTVWFTLFHTPIPFNWLAKKLSEDEQIEIGKISGSLSKGFRIEKIEFWEKPDEVSVLEDIRFLYPNLLDGLRKDEFDIEEIGVSRARLYLSSMKSTGIPNEDRNQADTETEKDSSPGEESIDRFRIGKIDIHNVKIIDPSQDFEFRLDECMLNGFDATGQSIRMGQLVIHSSYLTLNLSPVETDKSDTPTSSDLEIKATLQPNDSFNVRKLIKFSGNIDLSDTRNPQGHVEAFGGKLLLTFIDKPGESALAVDDLTLADYLNLDIILPARLSWEATIKKVDGAPSVMYTQSGSFIIGDTRFTIHQGTPENPAHIWVATHEVDGQICTYTLVGSDGPKHILQLSSSDDQPSREILAELQFGKPFQELEAPDQKRIRQTLGEEKL